MLFFLQNYGEMNKKIGIQLGITLVFIILYHLFETQLSQTQYIICAAAILLFGIPHGAIDHLLERYFHQKNRQSNDKLFILQYVLVMGIYLLFWVLIPFPAFLFFIALGVYHFGQEFIEESHIRQYSKIGSVLWGSFILVMPLLFHYEESRAYISITTHTHLPTIAAHPLQFFAFSIPFINMLYFSSLFVRKHISAVVFARIFLQIAIWTVIYFYTPFLIGFTLYFVVFHSFNSMEHQYVALLKLKKQYQLKNYLRDLSAFTLLSYVGVVILFLFIDLQQWRQLMLYSLIFIAVLTLPHMIVFERFYAHRKY